MGLYWISWYACSYYALVYSITSCDKPRLSLGTVDYIKMHSVSVHKIGNASEFPGPELGPTQNCLPVHNTKCMLL